MILKEHIPVKQGLRPLCCDFCYKQTAFKEHIPVKQGLRLLLLYCLPFYLLSQRAYSSKTRIKTIHRMLFHHEL